MMQFRPACSLCFVIAISSFPFASAAEILWLDRLDVTLMRQAWSTPKANQSVSERPLSLTGTAYDHGIGTHANSEFHIDLKGSATRFTATVGIDDCAADAAGVIFRVYGDRKLLFESEQLHAGDQPAEIDLDLTGMRTLALIVDDCENGDKEDKADWADAKLEYDGEKPVSVVSPVAAPVGILTPPVPPEPRIAGPRVFGVRPGSPCLFAVPATGEAPLTFAVDGLPEGLALDPQTGRITGQLKTAGDHKLAVQVRNAKGTTKRELRIVCGEQIALTPPMGWTSRFGGAANATQQKIQDAADALLACGLPQHGWSYVCVDDGWQGTRKEPAYALQPNERFADLPGLSAYLHDKGLRFGIYSTPWRTTFQGFTGGSADDEKGEFTVRSNSPGKVAFCQADAKQFAAWGVDLLKYEWRPMDVPSTQACAQALSGCGRDIVLAAANGAQLESAREYCEAAQCVQTTGELPDRWQRIQAVVAAQTAWREFAGPGRWNDLDILLTGLTSPDLHPAAGLTENEQYAQMSLWCLNAAPLFFSLDPAVLKDTQGARTRFTLGLLSNDEVIEVDQDSLGQQARRIRADDESEVWLKEMADGSKVVGLFNRDRLGTISVKATWDELGLKGKYLVRDLWRQKDLGEATDSVQFEMNSHGVMLIRLTAAP
jgi:alpha-galactosidase